MNGVQGAMKGVQGMGHVQGMKGVQGMSVCGILTIQVDVDGEVALPPSEAITLRHQAWAGCVAWNESRGWMCGTGWHLAWALQRNALAMASTGLQLPPRHALSTNMMNLKLGVYQAFVQVYR